LVIWQKNGIAVNKLVKGLELIFLFSFFVNFVDAYKVLTCHLNILQAASEWLFIVPWGLQKLLNHVAKRYKNPVIYVTENGTVSIIPEMNVVQAAMFIHQHPHLS
jgi:hypothetical protein